MLDFSKPITQWVFLFFLAFVWGSSFILMKMGLQSFDNVQVACLRILISFLFLLPIFIRNFRQVKRKQWLPILIAGLLGSGIPAFLFTKAQTQISSSLTGMLNSLVPLFTVIIGLLFFGAVFRKLKALGALVGLAGAIALLWVNGGISVQNDDFLYASLVVLATICYATNVNFIKVKLAEVSSLNITTFGFALIGPASGIYLFTTDFTERMQNDSEAWLNLFFIALLAIFGTAIAVILFNMLIKKVSPVFASSVTYIIPVFAIFWGMVDGEQIKFAELICISIILTGVYLINRDNRLERREKMELAVEVAK
ncbi:MAG: EamA family transporter [Vicingaceae bacterium]